MVEDGDQEGRTSSSVGSKRNGGVVVVVVCVSVFVMDMGYQPAKGD